VSEMTEGKQRNSLSFSLTVLFHPQERVREQNASSVREQRTSFLSHTHSAAAASVERLPSDSFMLQHVRNGHHRQPLLLQ
jgi:hypothetical protein